VPTIQLYVSAADRKWLDEQPTGFNAAALFREAISELRGEMDRCKHRHRELVCKDCGQLLSEAEGDL